MKLYEAITAWTESDEEKEVISSAALACVDPNILLNVKNFSVKDSNVFGWDCEYIMPTT